MLCNITKLNKATNIAIIATTSNCIISLNAMKNAAIKRNSKRSSLTILVREKFSALLNGNMIY